MKRKVMILALIFLLFLPAMGFTEDVEDKTFKIVDVRRVPSVEPDRIGKYDQLVMYELDAMRRYTVRIPDEGFTEERMVQAVREDILRRFRFTGREYEIGGEK